MSDTLAIVGGYAYVCDGCGMQPEHTIAFDMEQRDTHALHTFHACVKCFAEKVTHDAFSFAFTQAAAVALAQQNALRQPVYDDEPRDERAPAHVGAGYL